MNVFPESCAQMDILQGWSVVKTIGTGSYGTVYHVRHEQTGKEAALKWIHIERNEKNTVGADAFLNVQTHLLNEIGMLRSLSDSPEIVSIQDYAYQISPDGNKMDSFIRMELLTPLLSLIQKQELTVQQVTDLVNDIGRALQTCHERNIVHGDVKPENILFGQQKYKLSDFGVSLSTLFINRQFPPGTQVFQPLEYEQGMPASPQGDIYSFGLMIYILFNNGLLPFQTKFTKEDEMEACQKRRDNARLPDGSVFFPRPENAVGVIGKTICKAVSPDPAQRYQTVQEFVNDFNAAVSSLSETEKNLLLPYGKTDAEFKEESRIYLSTGRMTPRFDPHSDAAAESEKSKSNPGQDGGFLKPGQEKKIEQTASKSVKNREQTAPAKKKTGLITAVVVLVLVAVLAIFVLPGLQKMEYTLSVQPTQATLVFSGVDQDMVCTVKCLPENSAQKARVFQAKAGKIVLDGLAPETAYQVRVTLGSKEETITLKTSKPENGLFHPKSQRILAGKAADFDENTMEKLMDITDSDVTVENTRLQDAGNIILFTTTNETEMRTIEQQTILVLVLRTEDGAVYTKTENVEPFTLQSASFRPVSNVTELFDAYYDDFSETVKGNVKLEMYWMNELLGAASTNFTRKGE